MAAEDFPNSYKDPLYASLDAKTEAKLGLPDGLLSSIRLNGERTNNDQSPSDTKAKSPYQFIPATRQAIIKKYGIDPLLSPANASEAAGLLLKEGLDRNKGDPAAAVGEYIGGTDRANWGKTTQAYIQRVTGNLSAPVPSSDVPGKPAPGQSTFDRVSSALDKPEASAMAAVLKAYQSGQMSPEDAKTFEQSVNDGHVMLPQGVSLKPAAAGAPAMPDALAKAYQSGAMDPADKAQLDDLIKQGVVAAPKGASQIPGQTEGAPSNVSQKEAAPTVGQQVVGAGEAALNLGTGLVSGAAAPVVGLANALTTPDASQGNLQGASNAAERFAQNNTYAPRTAAGQNQAEAVGNVMANAAPLMGHAGELAAIGGLAKPTTQVIAPVVRDTAGQAAANVASGVRNVIPEAVTNIPAKVGEMMGREPAPATPTPGTLGSVGAAGVDMATQRRMAAQDLPVPLDITEGMATRDFAQQRFEKETAKDPVLGAPLRERVQELNSGILRNFDAMVDLTGAESPDLRTTGTVVTQALRDQLAKDKTKVRVAYKAAEKAGDMEAPVTLSGFVDHLNENAPDAAVAPLLDAAKKRALQLGIATEGADGVLVAQPVTLKTAETARRAISNATGFDPTNVYHSTLLKQSIDSATDGLGGNLYRAARAERARLAENYQNHAAISDLIGTKRGTGDRQVAVEDVFRRSILNGSVDDIRQVRRVLQRSGEQGSQAWRELQGQTLKSIKEQALGSARDAAGNATISAHALNKAVTTLDSTGKLDFIFGKKGAETIRTLNDVVNSIRTSPEGAVNTSNTASVLAGLVDVAFTVGSGGVPLPVATGLRIAVNNVKDRRIRAQVNHALGVAQRKEAARPRPVPTKKTIH